MQGISVLYKFLIYTLRYLTYMELLTIDETLIFVVEIWI